jgi:hypothetical protein
MLPIPVMPTDTLASHAKAVRTGTADISAAEITVVTVGQDLRLATRQSLPWECKFTPRVHPDDHLYWIKRDAIA